MKAFSHVLISRTRTRGAKYLKFQLINRKPYLSMDALQNR
jgi:hypothetical protein